jgi:hypothetical protein
MSRGNAAGAPNPLGSVVGVSGKWIAKKGSQGIQLTGTIAAVKVQYRKLLLTSGLSQSNDYYERIVISMCRSLPNQSSYPSNSVLT